MRAEYDGKQPKEFEKTSASKLVLLMKLDPENSKSARETCSNVVLEDLGADNDAARI
jgi:hypothetical protein